MVGSMQTSPSGMPLNAVLFVPADPQAFAKANVELVGFIHVRGSVTHEISLALEALQDAFNGDFDIFHTKGTEGFAAEFDACMDVNDIRAWLKARGCTVEEIPATPDVIESFVRREIHCAPSNL